MPMIPLLVLRKLWVAMRPDERVVSAGFESGPVVDRMLALLSRCEHVPQHLAGTSLMAVLVRAT